MIGTFVRLAAWSMKNRVVTRLRRLRQPRYLAGLVFGVAYFYWAVIRNQVRAARGGQSWLHWAQAPGWAPDIAIAAGFVLWVVVGLSWLFSSQGAWRFTGAEVQFFYTAPVPRRHLIHYKLLRGQVGTLFGILVGGFFSGAIFAGSSARWSFVIGGWLLFSTLSLHMTAISLVKTRLRSAPGRRTWQAWLPVAVMAGLSAALVVDLATRIARLPADSFDGTIEPALEVARSGVAGVVLWPFATLARPILAASWSELGMRLLPVIGLAALNYAWVLRADSSAADATLATERAVSRGRRIARPVVRPQPFRLAPTGRPEVALLWKNLILLGRYASLLTLGRWLPPLVVIAVLVSHEAGSVAIPIVALILAAYATLLGPMVMRNDVRQDLPRLRLLKTWPIDGRSLLAGELAAPTVALSVAVWASLVIALAGSGAVPEFARPFWIRASVAITAMIVAPALIAGQLVIQNAAVILLPGWIPTGEARPRGIEATGQNLIAFVGSALAFVLGLLPAALIGGGLGVAGFFLVGFGALPFAAMVTSGVLFAEVAGAVLVLGRMLGQIEPSQVESAE